MINTILQGDVLAVLKTLPDQMVDCVVTSPPYWGLRDYGTAEWEGGNPDCDHIHFDRADNGNGGKTSTLTGKGAPYHDQDRNRDPHRDICGKCGAIRIDKQIGLEPTIEEYIDKLTEVFREVRRVLKDTGTFWLNMGDGYNGSGKAAGQGNGTNFGKPLSERPYDVQTATKVISLKPKDLIGQPWRLAFALQQPWLKCKGCAKIGHKSKWGRFPNGRLICPCCVKSQGWDIAEPGWYLRSDIIWHKPNPMPESCTDRPTKSHEYMFLMSKKPQYFYDAEAIKEPQEENERCRRLREQERGLQTKYTLQRDDPHGQVPPGENGCARSVVARQRLAMKGTRNKRTVWTIATQSYREAHFATFPEKLVEPCIRAGTSERGYCAECGLPWVRVVENHRGIDENGICRGCGQPVLKHIVGAKNLSNDMQGIGPPYVTYKGRLVKVCRNNNTIGWRPSCACGADTVPGWLLDPFMGSGTVGVVAAKNGRNWLGIELNLEYIEMAKKRIPARQEQLIF